MLLGTDIGHFESTFFPTDRLCSLEMPQSLFNTKQDFTENVENSLGKLIGKTNS